MVVVAGIVVLVVVVVAGTVVVVVVVVTGTVVVVVVVVTGTVVVVVVVVTGIVVVVVLCRHDVLLFQFPKIEVVLVRHPKVAHVGLQSQTSILYLQLLVVDVDARIAMLATPVHSVEEVQPHRYPVVEPQTLSQVDRPRAVPSSIEAVSGVQPDIRIVAAAGLLEVQL